MPCNVFFTLIPFLKETHSLYSSNEIGFLLTIRTTSQTRSGTYSVSSIGFSTIAPNMLKSLAFHKKPPRARYLSPTNQPPSEWTLHIIEFTRKYYMVSIRKISSTATHYSQPVTSVHLLTTVHAVLLRFANGKRCFTTWLAIVSLVYDMVRMCVFVRISTK